MLPQSARLSRGAEIREVSRTGSRSRSGPLSVTISSRVSTLSNGHSRACVVVGRPVGDAVTRNRARRRIRHALAEILPSIPVPVDVVVRTAPGVADLDAATLRGTLHTAVSRGVERALAREVGR